MPLPSLPDSNSSKAIYAYLTGQPPLTMVAVSIHPDHYERVALCIDRVTRRRTIKELKHIQYSTLLRVVSVVNFIRMSTYGEAVSCYKKYLTQGDLYQRTLEYNVLLGFRSLSSLMQTYEPIDVRTSIHIKNLGPRFRLCNKEPVNHPMLIAYSFAKVLYEETNM